MRHKGGYTYSAIFSHTLRAAFNAALRRPEALLSFDPIGEFDSSFLTLSSAFLNAVLNAGVALNVAAAAFFVVVNT